MFAKGMLYFLTDFQEAFGLFDKDGDGYLSVSEIGVIVRSVGGVVTEAELTDMAAQFIHKNDLIDFADFLSMMATLMARNVSPNELLEAFQVFDQDGKGYITTTELRHLMTNLGEKLTDDDFEEMITEADAHGTGRVNYTEFVKMMTN